MLFTTLVNLSVSLPRTKRSVEDSRVLCLYTVGILTMGHWSLGQKIE